MSIVRFLSASLFVSFIFLQSSLCLVIHAQSARRNGNNAGQFDPVVPGTEEFQSRSVGSCPKNYRTYDGSCTNLRNKLWGSAGLPHFSYIHGRSSKIPTGKDLPSARLVSNVLSAQTDMDMFNNRNLSEFLVFFGQFVDHTFSVTSSNKSEPMPIEIPPSDPIFANFTDGVLHFHRSNRGLVMQEGRNVERPVNSLSSAIDLAVIYSSDSTRIRWLRTYKDGLLKMSNNQKLPINTDGIVNAPTKGRKFYLSGDHRANEHPVLTAFHTIFVREHNRLCKELKKEFPTWTDFRLFQMARKVNGAQFQKIVYDEWLPALIGRNLQPYRGYRKTVNPTLSDIFSTAAFRVGHTMVGNGLPRRGKKNEYMSTLPVSEMFFRSVDIMKDGFEPFLRGVMNRRAQEVDTLVVPALRNFLFTNVPQEKGFDLIALNIQRGRDHALPTYNEIRALFNRRRAKKFRHITSDVNLQSRLQSVYGTTDKVEAWIGLLAEDHVTKSSVGKTLLRILKTEFTRLRDGDRFFYQRWNLFPWSFWTRFPRFREMMFEKDTMKQLLLRNSEITEEEIGKSVWQTLE